MILSGLLNQKGGDNMSWQPRVNRQMFTQVADRVYMLNDGSGQVFTNPLQVQMLSDIYTRAQKGEATQSQTQTLKTIYGYQDNQDFTVDQLIKRNKPISPTFQLEGQEYLDYIPNLEEPPQNWSYENQYNNFMLSFLDATNPEIFKLLYEAMEATGLSKSQLGEALSKISSDILDVIGYSGLGSEEAIRTFVGTLVEYVPIDENYKRELSNQIFDMQFGEGE